MINAKFKFKNYSNKCNLLVYGAGDAGRHLVIALENSNEFKVIGFLDDDRQLHKQVILNKSVYSPNKLYKLINSKDISLISHF